MDATVSEERANAMDAPERSNNMRVTRSKSKSPTRNVRFESPTTSQLVDALQPASSDSYVVDSLLDSETTSGGGLLSNIETDMVSTIENQQSVENTNLLAYTADSDKGILSTSSASIYSTRRPSPARDDHIAVTRRVSPRHQNSIPHNMREDREATVGNASDAGSSEAGDHIMLATQNQVDVVDVTEIDKTVRAKEG